MLRRYVLILPVILLTVHAALAAEAVPAEMLTEIRAAVPDHARVTPQAVRRMLVFNRCEGFGHKSIPYIAAALEIMGAQTGAYQVEQSTDMDAFTAENLARFDAVCFNNTTRLAFDNPEHRAALLAFVRGGRGLVGIHAATDNFYTWPEAAEMLGGQFVNHPWHAGGTWAFKLEDPDHPLNAAFAGRGFRLSDEIYYHKTFDLRRRARVLLSLDLDDPDTHAADPKATDVPVAWIRQEGQGRIFYSSLGHNLPLVTNRMVLQHWLDGIQFALGDLPADASPSGPDLSQLDDMLAAVRAYQPEEDRIVLSPLTHLVYDARPFPAARQQLEKAFAAFLKTDATPAAKEFVCRQLRTLATAASVPALAGLLADPATVEMARYALEAIPAESAGAALLGALDKAPPPARVGIINSLGKRADAGLAAALTAKLNKLIHADDDDLARAALVALGQVDHPEALRVLKTARQGPAGPQRDLALRVTVDAAERLLRGQQQAKAVTLLAEVYQDQTAPLPTRARALQGWLRTQPEAAAQRIEQAVAHDPPELALAAIAYLREAPANLVTGLGRRLFEELEPGLQAPLLYAVCSRGQANAAKLLEKALQSPDEAVRVAALDCMVLVGSAEQVGLLAQRAATARGAERDAARASLAALPGKPVDARIVQLIAGADPDVREELILAAGARQTREAADVVLQATTSDQRGVRLAALRVLREIGTAEQLAGSIDALLAAPSEAERREAVGTVVALAQTLPDQDGRRSVLLRERLAQTTDTAAAAALMMALGRVADAAAYDVLVGYLGEPNEDLRLAALRALADWPDARALPHLQRIARASTNRTVRTIALRGFVRQVGLLEVGPAQRLEFYEEAMKLTGDDAGEKKLVLSGLGDVGTVEAMEMAARYLDDPALRAEAELAVLGNAELTAKENPAATRELLAPVLAGTTSETVRERAQTVMNETEKLSTFLLSWQMTGPYALADVAGNKLFDIALGPETADAQDVDWQPLPPSRFKDQPWHFNFDEMFSADHSALYVRCHVWVPTAQPGVLALGSDDAIKAWLNGELVHAHNASRGLHVDQDRVDVQLRSGWNEIMLKVVDYAGNWAFSASLRTPAGGAIPGMRVSPSPPQ